jgi:hypothetical protein
VIAKVKRAKAKMSSKFLDACLRFFFYMLDRLAEASTLRAIVAGLGGALSFIKPERIDAIFGMTLIIIGAIGAFLPDHLRRRSKRGKSVNDTDVDKNAQKDAGK